jgi:hypothetical protein
MEFGSCKRLPGPVADRAPQNLTLGRAPAAMLSVIRSVIAALAGDFAGVRFVA